MLDPYGISGPALHRKIPTDVMTDSVGVEHARPAAAETAPPSYARCAASSFTMSVRNALASPNSINVLSM
jgi:hypothetical protein